MHSTRHTSLRHLLSERSTCKDISLFDQLSTTCSNPDQHAQIRRVLLWCYKPYILPLSNEPKYYRCQPPWDYPLKKFNFTQKQSEKNSNICRIQIESEFLPSLPSENWWREFSPRSKIDYGTKNYVKKLPEQKITARMIDVTSQTRYKSENIRVL